MRVTSVICAFHRFEAQMEPLCHNQGESSSLRKPTGGVGLSQHRLRRTSLVRHCRNRGIGNAMGCLRTAPSRNGLCRVKTAVKAHGPEPISSGPCKVCRTTELINQSVAGLLPLCRVQASSISWSILTSMRHSPAAASSAQEARACAGLPPEAGLPMMMRTATPSTGSNCTANRAAGRIALASAAVLDG